MLRAIEHGDVLSNYIKAGSHRCSPQLLKTLANSEIDRIRLRVAENPRTPKNTLEMLAADKNPDVRVAVGTNPSSPAHVLHRLASDDDPNVRLGLADDINTPIEVLNKLTEDSNPYVSYRALQTRQLVTDGEDRSLGQRFLRWVTQGADEPELRYA